MPSSETARCPPRGGLGDLEPERLARRCRFLDPFHSFDLLELAHRLRSLGSHRAKPIRELLKSRDFFLLIFERRELLLVSLLSLPEVILVVAAVGDQLLLGDFMHLAHHLIHELAVVRN